MTNEQLDFNRYERRRRPKRNEFRSRPRDRRDRATADSESDVERNARRRFIDALIVNIKNRIESNGSSDQQKLHTENEEIIDEENEEKNVRREKNRLL